jgi:hypothetical protein
MFHNGVWVRMFALSKIEGIDFTRRVSEWDFQTDVRQRLIRLNKWSVSIENLSAF